MDKFNKVKTNASIVFLPDYTVKAFKNAGVTLEEIAVLGNLYYTDQAREFSTWSIENDKFNFMDTKLKKRMAVSDLVEIAIINNYLYQQLLGHTRNRDVRPVGTIDFVNDLSNFSKWGSGIAFDKHTVITDFINNYKNLDKDVSSILVSGNKEEAICSYETYENTVFVILHEGFTNLVIGNDNTLVKQFSIKLMDYVFNRLGEDVTLKSSLLRMFMNLHRR